jgi:hypothetical protein
MFHVKHSKKLYICSEKNPIKLKVKLNKQQIDSILADPEQAANAKVKVSDPWWVIVIKIVAYVCGLLLAGACTAYVV